MAKKVEVTQTEEPVAVEIIAQAIVDIAAGMKKVNGTRLTQKAIVTLIHAHTNVRKTDIITVLDNLSDLERFWLKPKK